MTDERQEQAEYVWHFKLSTTASEGGVDDALSEMVREQVAALLRCITFTSSGVDVGVTGFRFLDAPETEHTLRPALPERDPPREPGLVDEGGESQGSPGAPY
jgi:hypothetical protein